MGWRNPRLNESIYDRMQKHGLLNDPESRKVDAIRGTDVSISPAEFSDQGDDQDGDVGGGGEFSDDR